MSIGKFSEFYVDVTKDATKIPQEQYLAAGRYPIIDQGQKSIAGMWDNPDGLYEKVPAIVFGDHTRALKYVDMPFFIGADGVKVLRPAHAGDNVKYLFYVLQAARIPNLGYSRHFKVLKELEIQMYPRKMQDEIVRVLEQIDSLLEQQQNEILQMDQLVKSRFVEMFGENVPTARLGSVCQMINGDRGKNYPSGEDFVPMGVPFVNAGHLQEGRVDFSSMNYITEEKYALLSQGKMRRNDILYCLRGSLGKHGLVDFDRGAVASSLVILRCNEQRILPQFLFYAIETPEIEKQLKAANNGSSQPNLSAASVKAYNIKLPPINKQAEFAAFVAEVDKSKLAVKQSLEKLETLKKSLMQQYFG